MTDWWFSVFAIKIKSQISCDEKWPNWTKSIFEILLFWRTFIAICIKIRVSLQILILAIWSYKLGHRAKILWPRLAKNCQPGPHPSLRSSMRGSRTTKQSLQTPTVQFKICQYVTKIYYLLVTVSQYDVKIFQPYYTEPNTFFLQDLVSLWKRALFYCCCWNDDDDVFITTTKTTSAAVVAGAIMVWQPTSPSNFFPTLLLLSLSIAWQLWHCWRGDEDNARLKATKTKNRISSVAYSPLTPGTI